MRVKSNVKKKRNGKHETSYIIAGAMMMMMVR